MNLENFSMKITNSHRNLMVAVSAHFLTNDQSAGLLDILKICKRDTFPNVHSLLLSLAVCPISSVCVERFFSTVNRVMIPSRKSMGTKRLNNLCLLSVERDLTLYLQKNVKLVKAEYRKLLKTKSNNVM